MTQPVIPARAGISMLIATHQPEGNPGLRRGDEQGRLS